MDNLELAIALVTKAKEENDRLKNMERRLSKLSTSDPDYWKKFESIRYSYNPVPKKTSVNDYIKLARRILSNCYLE